MRDGAAEDGLEVETPVVGQILGMSEQAVGSIIGMLAEAGKVRICSGERVL